ncbi:MAG: short-subunit dehydrogenase, partial [Arenicella sp.]
MKKTVWITGASSGIGEALTYEYAQLGWQVIISARRESVLEEVKSNCENAKNIQLLPLDLA